MKNKNIIIIISIAFVLVLGLGIYGYIESTNKEEKQVKEVDNKEETQKTEEKNNEEEKETSKTDELTNINLIKQTDYDFYGKKLKISFDGKVEGNDSNNISEYETIFMNIYDSNGKEILADVIFTLFEPADEVNVDNYLKSLDYFEDTNGQKYMVIRPVYTDGAGYVFLDLENGKQIFSLSFGDIGDYEYSTFKSLEKELDFSFKKYFDQYPKGIIVNHNLIRYFKLEFDEKALYYIEMKIENGEVKETKEKIKSYGTMSDEDFDQLYVPGIYTSMDDVD